MNKKIETENATFYVPNVEDPSASLHPLSPGIEDGPKESNSSIPTEAIGGNCQSEESSDTSTNETSPSPTGINKNTVQRKLNNPTMTQEEDDFIIFHCVSYLGAATIKEARSEREIQEIMSFLSEHAIDKAIQVSVSVPLSSDGFVIVYEEDNQLEISRFKINQIIFFARGLSNTPDAACFAFTCSHGENLDDAIFQCHTFRCEVSEAIGNVFKSFARAFESTPKVPSQNHTSQNGNEIMSPNQLSINSESNSEPFDQKSIFEVSLEIREDDGKGNFTAVKGDKEKGCFRLRSCVGKQIVLTVQQVPDVSKELNVEKCFGLLLSPGRHVRNSDMQLVEMLSWSIGSNGSDRKSYVVTGQWDYNDPAFEALNQETSKDSCVFFTIAADLVIKGIQEPIRFALETKAKISPSPAGIYRQIIGRKHHYTQQFALLLKKVEGNSAAFRVISVTALGEVDKNKTNLNLNFTSFIRSGSVPSFEGDTPTKEYEEESDDDEPLQSGMGEISKFCTDEQLTAWGHILTSWPANASSSRPKQLYPLVRVGIPDTMRGEIWLRLAGCHDDLEMMDTYKNLLNKDYSNEEIILRDINRTFPANDYFKESGGKGQEQLYKISKGYAVYDTDVGYCQGISFVGAAILLQMPEEQSFCLLVRIMYNYGFRDLYRDGFDNLHLKLNQLSRLIEDQIPELWTHFVELGIETHMFASQWFLTLYTAKFPLNFVFRVIDLFLLDGMKTLFQIAIGLLSSSRKDLLVLDFEGILKYFRVVLPKKYKNPENTSNFFKSAILIKVKKIAKYEAEYLAIKEQEKNYVDPLTKMTREYKRLMEEVIQYEYLITNLVLGKASADEVAVSLLEELNRTKLTLKEMEDFNIRLKEETNSVKEIFQREVKQYDAEGVKKSNIISEYKKICSKLSSRLEEEQQVAKEKILFFQSNLCQNCASFVSTAMTLAGEKMASGDSGSPANDLSPSGTSSPNSGPTSANDYLIQPLESELAKTKIALAEAECRNDDLSHQLQMALAELESIKKDASGPTWLWKNLSFNKDVKRTSSVEYEPTPNANINPSSNC